MNSLDGQPRNITCYHQRRGITNQKLVLTGAFVFFLLATIGIREMPQNLTHWSFNNNNFYSNNFINVALSLSLAMCIILISDPQKSLTHFSLWKAAMRSPPRRIQIHCTAQSTNCAEPKEPQHPGIYVKQLIYFCNEPYKICLLGQCKFNGTIRKVWLNTFSMALQNTCLLYGKEMRFDTFD